MRKAVDEVKREVFPETFGYEYSGMAREEADNANSNETLLIYGICMLLIYLIMACLYDSLFIPLAIMLSIPFALFGAYLFIIPMESMGVGANVYVQTGIIMMIGEAKGRHEHHGCSHRSLSGPPSSHPHDGAHHDTRHVASGRR